MKDYRVEHHFEQIGRRIMLLSATPILADGMFETFCWRSLTSRNGSWCASSLMGKGRLKRATSKSVCPKSISQ